MKEKEVVVNEESALEQFEQWAESMAIDIDETHMDEEDLTAFSKQKRRIVKAMMFGHAVLNDDDEIVYTPCNTQSKFKDALRFRERTGASAMAMDGKKKNHEIAKTYAIMADLVGVHPSVFAGLKGVDIKVCEAIFALLMD